MPRGHSRPSSIGVAIGRRLRALRQEQGLGQAELARQAGISVAHLNKLELGGSRAPNVTTLEALARALGVGITDLFADEGKPADMGRPNRAWLNIATALRGKPPEYLRSIAALMRTLDSAIEHTTSRRG